MNSIRVAIADDHKIFRKGIIVSLRQYANIDFVQEAENGQDLLNGIDHSKPDVVLMDLRMPVVDGIEATKIISEQYTGIHVIVLSMYEDEHFVSHLMDNGASGYLLKSAEPSEIKKAIVDVIAKGYYLNHFLNKILLNRTFVRAKLTPSLKKEIVLNEKEKQVIRYLCMEFTAVEIAKNMEISHRTVEAIKNRLMERFKVKNTAGLVFFSVKNDLIE